MRAVRGAPRHRSDYYPDRSNYYPGPDCRVCGRKAINVVHEMDPDNAPEGRAYYDEHVPDRHPFIPSTTEEPERP